MKTETVIAEPLALVLNWKGKNLASLNLHWAKDMEESDDLSMEAKQLKESLQRYVNGEDPDWPDLPMSLESLPRFHRRSIKALKDIPSGKTVTYGELAEKAGSPKGAQAAGQAMRKNPYPLVYPCHRVVGKNGKMVGYSCDGGTELKKFLLDLEA